MGQAKPPPSHPRSVPRELITNDRWDMSSNIVRSVNATVTVPINTRGHAVPFPPGTLVWLSYSRGTDAMMLTFDVFDTQPAQGVAWSDFYNEHAVEVHEDEVGIVMEVNHKLHCESGEVRKDTRLHELWLVMHYLVEWSGHPGRPSWARYDWIVPWADLVPTAGD